MDIFYLVLCLSLLFFTFCSFIHHKYLCETMNPSIDILVIPYFMAPPPDFFHAATYKLPWDTKSNRPYLTGVITYIYLIKNG